MKNSGILHPELSYLVASLGHTDYIVLADKGLPIPNQLQRINLGITDDLPTIPQVLNALSLEMTIDRVLITHEMAAVSPGRLEELKKKFPAITLEEVSHAEFKELCHNGAYTVVKTGDTCPYGNLIVVSG